jgi:membrane protein
VDALKERFRRLRERFALLDHVVRMLGHYGSVNGAAQAGAVTYFGFLSVFPILALAVFVVGLLATVYPDIRVQMVAEIDKLLPGVVGSGKNEINLDDMGHYSGLAGAVGLVGVLYAGLNWLSGLRSALEVVFVVPRREQPGFLPGKLRDLVTLGVLGLVLVVSVVLSGAVTGFSGAILGWVGIDEQALLPQLALGLLGHVLAIVASTVLLLAMFRLLAEPHVPRAALLRGALLGAVGFEVLKLVANLLLAQTQGQPAFQAFGVALILVVWINYFSRLVMYAAAWAYTSPVAVEQRTREAIRAPGAAVAGDPPEPPAPTARLTGDGDSTSPRPGGAVAAAAAAGGLVAWLVRGAAR